MHRQLSGWRVVVASSSPERRRELARELRARSCYVSTASDGPALLRYLAGALDSGRPARRPDLIIADVELPGCSGLGVLEGIRELGWTTTFFLIVERPNDEVARRAFAAGATRVMSSTTELESIRAAAMTCLLLDRPRGARRARSR